LKGRRLAKKKLQGREIYRATILDKPNLLGAEILSEYEGNLDLPNLAGAAVEHAPEFGPP